MTYRIRNILIAVGLALVAMLLTLFYITNYKRSVEHSTSGVPVYVAVSDLTAGTPGAEIVKQHELRVETVQQRDVVPGAISSPQQVSGLLLAAPVYAGEQVTLRRFSDVAAQGIRSQLKGTLRAVQVAGDPNQLLAGTLVAGDHVDLVANLRLQSNTTSTATRIVLRDLTVLTAPNDPTLGKVSTTSGGDSVILAVTDTQVQRLFFVLKDADWTLELRPVVGAVDSPERVDTLNTVLQAGAK
ncbi:MAG TPA: Flp pilus assembly protein CpaB [Gaiellaceae bacterium]|jgi:Flp pilus assembly protein CpaB|nr:Flp pilus assembly protein CpaB [Gaiellaceae bacterium]